jgi:aminoglycoside phosphotransferase (APT) family kinase protein
MGGHPHAGSTRESSGTDGLTALLSAITMTREGIREALLRGGIVCDEDELEVEVRDGATVARLPGDRIAWFADGEGGRRRLERERRVLRLLEKRCSFRAPRVTFESPDGGFDVRAAVPGEHIPWKLYERAKDDRGFAARMGRELGAIMAEQHTKVLAADVAGWIPMRPGWPEPSAWIRERLPRVTDDARLRDAIDALLARYDAVEVDDGDRVLLHGDLGFHNIAVDAETHEVRGIFDYGDASWWDRHHDLRYFLFDVESDAMLEAALAVYEPATGRRVSRERIALHNAVSAASFLAFRDGVAPEACSCGRTLEQDLGWTRAALARAG